MKPAVIKTIATRKEDVITIEKTRVCTGVTGKFKSTFKANPIEDAKNNERSQITHHTTPGDLPLTVKPPNLTLLKALDEKSPQVRRERFGEGLNDCNNSVHM
jgi:hypothetical protein